MTRVKKTGFTIIETMLFLAITGVMVAALMAGVGISLNNQRYKDSVQSFRSYLQSQYSNLTNTFNDRDGSWSCNSSASAVQPNGGVGQVRGQSECFLVGKYVTIVDKSITESDVLGRSNGGHAGGDDIDKLANYNLSVSSIHTLKSQLEWGTRIGWPVSGTDSKARGTSRSLAILFIRSPDSGAIYTFTSDTAVAPGVVKQADLRKMLVKNDSGNTATAEKGQRQRVICVDSDGLSTGGDTSVIISARASNSTAIDIWSNAILQENGISSRC